MSYAITSPFPSFNDTDGSPLNNGNVYVGSANLNPVTDPIPVYWDEALTQPAAQPIRTINGYFSRNGSPGRLYTGFITYSIRVTNNKGALVFSDLNYRDPSTSAGSTYQQVITAISGQTVFNLSRTYIPGTNNLFVYRNGLRLIVGQDYTETGYSQITLTAGADNGDEFVFDIGYNYDTAANIDAQDVTYKLPDSSSVFTNVEAKLAESVSVKDFGAVGDGVTDDTAAFTAAAATGLAVYVPSGSYNLTTNVTGYWNIAAQVSWTGAGTASVQERGYWPDVGAGANINRVRDRLFVNDGAAFTGNRSGTQGGFVPTSTEGASWAPRDSSLFVAQDNGLMAVTGFVSNANIDITAGLPTESIGVSGFAIGNKANRSVWSLYGDIQFTQGNYGFGLELAIKNLEGVNRSSTPYVFTSGAYGIWLAAGGDPSYGGTPTNPSNTAIAIGKNGSTWNKGIIFRSDGITGTDGITGVGTAIEMAKGHQLIWRTPTNYFGFTVRSDVTNDTANLTIAAQNNYLAVYAYSGICVAFQASSTPANYLNIFNSSAGSYPIIAAAGSDTNIGLFYQTKGTTPHRFVSQNSLANEEFRAGGVNSAPVNFLHAYGTNSGSGSAVLSAGGSDTNVDMQLLTKGTGLLRFGTLVANADAPITGYIMIKDASGTQRKLAVIA